MISVVLYGRNDSYGYNLHKRAALSLNCIAELLSGPNDEILFVDYNTPNDFPVFLEAIQDTLTPKARAITRCLRVRPHVHAQFAHRTHLVALESIARNVAVRRSNPSNRWILSTNTDMIFVPHRKGSLTEIADGLPDGFYHAPRMEIPETLWESTDRTKPAEIIETIRRWGSHLYLNEIVHGSKTILYDGPGDFQLCLRDDMFRIQGFHEDMLLGWHVDSNLAARLSLIHGPVGDLGEDVWGYHCDHTRQITPMHAHNRLENDWVTYGERVRRPDLPEHAQTWGCAQHEIEEVRVDGKTVAGYIGTLEHAVGEPLAEPLKATISRTAEDVGGYEPRHTLPFLLDLFATERRDFRVAWCGLQPEILGLFAKAWSESGFSEPILCDEAVREHLSGLDGGAVRFAPAADCRELADAFLFDVTMALDGAEDDSEAPDAALREALVVRPFLAAVEADRARLGTPASLRRFIAIGAINNRFERLMRSVIGTGQTPYSTRLRHGFVLAPPSGAFPILKEMGLGIAGERYYKTIETIPGVAGPVLSGPWRYFEPGAYVARLRITPARAIGSPVAVGLFKHYALGEPVQTVPLVVSTEAAKVFEIFFDVPPRGDAILPEIYDFQVTAAGVEDFTVDDLVIEKLERLPAASQLLALTTAPFADVGDWLPHMEYGAGFVRSRTGGRAEAGVTGYLVRGPYWPLPSGGYAVRLELACDSAEPDLVLGWLEVTIDAKLRMSRPLRPRDIVDGGVDAMFFFGQSADFSTMRRAEVRVIGSGASGVALRSLHVRKVHEAATDCANWLDGVSPTALARLDGGGVRRLAGEAGYLTEGPHWPVAAGAYEATLSWSGEDVPQDVEAGSFDIVLDGRDLAVRPLVGAGSAIQAVRVPFMVPADPTGQRNLVEMRLGARAPEPFSATSIVVQRIGDEATAIGNWINGMLLGPAGRLSATGAAALPGQVGYVLTGPYWPVAPGAYAVSLRIVAPGAVAGVALGDIEIAADGQDLLTRQLATTGAEAADVTIPFLIPHSGGQRPRPLELRIRAAGSQPFEIRSIGVRRIGTVAVDIPNWLAALSVGPAGEAGEGVVRARPGSDGYILTGPYFPIGAGRYELGLGLALASLPKGRRRLGLVECLVDGEVVGFTAVTALSALRGSLSLAFVAEKAGKIEIRVHSSGVAAFLVKSLRLARVI